MRDLIREICVMRDDYLQGNIMVLSFKTAHPEDNDCNLYQAASPFEDSETNIGK